MNVPDMLILLVSDLHQLKTSINPQTGDSAFLQEVGALLVL